MTTERKECKYLTEDGKSLKDGKFLAELDWNMEIEVKEQEQTKQVRSQDLDWERALFCQWPKMLEEELTYYTMLNGGTDVGYRFDFKIGQENTVIVHGTLYAARITQKVYEVFEKIVLAEADLTLRPTDPKTEGVLREYVEQGFHTHTPDPTRSEGETIMTDYDSGETIAFILDIPSSKIEELKQALEGLEIKFVPENQVIAFNEAMMSQSVAMGHHLPGLVEGMNRCLGDAKLTPRIPDGHKKWSILRRQEFLQFAIDNFDWDDNTVTNTWWDNEGITWQELTQDHPLVFFEEQE